MKNMALLLLAISLRGSLSKEHDNNNVDEGQEELKAFYPEQGETSDTQRVWDLKMEPFEVPANETTYVDVVLNLPIAPEDQDKLFHITGVARIVVDDGLRAPHHILLFLNRDRANSSEHATPKASNVNDIRRYGYHKHLLGAWLPGLEKDKFVLPSEAGFLAGPGKGLRLHVTVARAPCDVHACCALA